MSHFYSTLLVQIRSRIKLKKGEEEGEGMAHGERPTLSDSPRPISDPPLRPDFISLSASASASAIRQGSQADRDHASSSQKEVADADARLIFVGDPDRTDPRRALPGNAVRTSKYSLFTFIPRNLFEQFRRLAYVYFLAIAVLNQLSQLAVFGRGASILPLAFVLLVTAVKDAYEDWRRHRSDRSENGRLASVLGVAGSEQFTSCLWKDVRVGQVIKVLPDESIPCDMVLLGTSHGTGIAYVQTINLDGESNFKSRYAKQETLSRLADITYRRVDILTRCERPNRNIYGFSGNLEIDGKRTSLMASNIILRGSELKNTAWAIGVAVYTGNDTKVMRNSSDPPSKRSRLETHMNRETLLLSVILVTLCSVVTILSCIWLVKHKSDLELMQYFRKRDYTGGDEKNYNYYGIALQVFFIFLMAVIVFQIMIPISLYISMELVWLGQAYFMIRDVSLYDENSNSRFQCRALNINEDLGQIKYVFSDKTGTLTDNKMEFQCCSIHGVDYSEGKDPSPTASSVYYVIVGDQFWRPTVLVKTDPKLVRLLRSRGETNEGRRAHDFFLALAACNTIVPLIIGTPDPKQKIIDYQGESPDEQALVFAAAAYGFVLIERTSEHLVIDVLGDRQRLSLLGLHEFDSDRKRMSVMIRGPDETIRLFVKGADSSMFEVLEKSMDLDIIHGTETNLHSYSSIGLRTLVVGMRELSTNDFQEWKTSYEKASTALYGRGSLLRAVASGIENDLQILGASGIEDKLQCGVPEAIQCLRQAGIKVWILTGDKQETAISIGYSCKLLTNEMSHIVVNSNSKESCKRSLEDAIVMSNKFASASSRVQNATIDTEVAVVPLALIIDGTSLVYILETELEEELFRVATVCNVVLCCRVAPLQKAGIVALIKTRTEDMTLAVGDGRHC